MNGWSARFVREVLDALGASARARSALLEGPPGAALGSPAMALPTAAQLAGALSVQPQLVQTVDIELDLHVWYRSIAGTQPTLAWLERGAMLWVALGDAPSVALTVDHTLFIDGNLNGDPNHELYLKNQPILAACSPTCPAASAQSRSSKASPASRPPATRRTMGSASACQEEIDAAVLDAGHDSHLAYHRGGRHALGRP